MAEHPAKPSERASTKLFEQLKTAELARRAGLSTGAFYNRWPTRDDFIEDFLDYALSIDRYPNPSAYFDAFAAQGDASFVEVLTEVSIANALAAEGNPTYAIQKYLWSFCRDREDVARRLQALYAEIRERLVPLLVAILEYTGREVRPPFTLETAAAALNATYLGLIEQRVPGGPVAPPAELFPWTGMAVFVATSRRIGDERDLFEALTDEVQVEGQNE